MTQKDMHITSKLTKMFFDNAEGYGITKFDTEGFGVKLELLPDKSYILEVYNDGILVNTIYDMLDSYELDEDGNLVELYI